MDKPQNIYDNEKFYKDYRDMREKGLNANELIEIPIMKDMLPDLKGKRILDLGCGNGGMSKYFIEKGAKSVLAIDLSSNMINEAKEKNNAENITYVVLGMEDISKIEGKFDIVFSSLAISVKFSIAFAIVANGFESLPSPVTSFPVEDTQIFTVLIPISGNEATESA